MTKRPRKALLLLVALIMALALPSATVVAQDGGTVIADGFNAPQDILVDQDGNIWIVEAGIGGETELEVLVPGTGEMGTATYGETSRIVKIDVDGTQTEIATLPSIFANDEAVGGSGIVFLNDQLFVTSGTWLGDGEDNPPPTIENTAAVLRLNDDGTLEQVAPTWRIERRMNPDNTIYESNPYGIAAGPDGKLWVADAAGNTLLRIDPESAIVELVTTFPPIPGVFPNPTRGGEMLTDPVPTALDFDDEGNAYVSLLSGAPFVPGSASVIMVTPGGTRTEYATNLTMLTDIRRGPDGEFYAVQFAVFTDQGPTPNSGAIIKIAEGDASEPVVEGLSFPTGLDFDADGNAYIAINGIGAPGSGAVVMYEGVAAGQTYLAPADTDGEATAEEEAESTEGATEEAEATEEPTAEATEEVTEEATAEAAEEPAEEATPEPTEEATEEATAEGTPEVTEEATEEPAEEATPEPTEEVTPEATEEPIEEPTAEATEEATAEAAQEDGSRVEAADQGSDGTQVIVDLVVAAQDGWMVIHADADGQPGVVLGQTAVAAGTTENVIVMLEEPVEPGAALWAMLHVDEGVQGVYEFPGPDVPVQEDDEIVMVSFNLLADATPEATPEATEEPTEEATPEATEEATPEVTEEATEEATPEPTEEVTPDATEEPIEEPTAEATDEATEEAPEEATEAPAEPDSGEKGAPDRLPNTGAPMPSIASIFAVVMAVVAALAGSVSIRRRRE